MLIISKLFTVKSWFFSDIKVKGGSTPTPGSVRPCTMHTVSAITIKDILEVHFICFRIRLAEVGY